MNKKIILFSLLITCFCKIYANQQEEQKPNYFLGSEQYFKFTPTTDISLIAIGLGLNGTSIVLDKFVDYKNRTYENQKFYIEDINTFDRWAMNPYSKPLDITADISLGLSLITPLVLINAPKTDYAILGSMYAETLLIANGIKELGKSLFFRPRPYMYFDNPPEENILDGDWADSFPSGHTTMAFAGATFTTFVFNKYFSDSAWKIPVIATSYTLATLTAVLRVCSGNHFLSDVLMGSIIGVSTGFLVPFLHTLPVNKKNKSYQITPLANGIHLSFYL